MSDVVTPIFKHRDGSAPSPRHAHVCAVTSGKGGVGKTNLSTNLGIALAQQGHAVCLVDADTGLANVNILLGKRPEKTLEHLLDEHASIEDIMMAGPGGLKVIPGASGIAEYAHMDAHRQQRLLSAVRQLEARFDYVLIDTAAGVANNVTRLVLAAHTVLLVITPDPTSLTDAFAMIRVLKRQGYDGLIQCVVNMAADARGARQVYERFSSAVRKYLNIRIELCGHIVADAELVQAVRAQVPVLVRHPQGLASSCIEKLGARITSISPDEQAHSLTDALVHAEAIAEPSPPADGGIHEPRNTTQPRDAIDIQSVSAQLLGAIQRNEADETSLNSALLPLFESYFQRFGHFPIDMRSASFRHLETARDGEYDMREQVQRIEQLFERRVGKPMHDREELLFRLLNQIRDSEPELQDSIHRLQLAYDARFRAPAADTLQRLVKRLESSDASADDFADAIESLRLMFTERFKLEYSVPDLALRKRMKSIIKDISERENARQEALLMLSAELGQHAEIQKQLGGLLDYLDND